MAQRSIISSSFAPPAPASAQPPLPPSWALISGADPRAPPPLPLPPPALAPLLKGLEGEAAVAATPERVAREIAAADASPAVITDGRPVIAVAAAPAAIFPCGEGGKDGGEAIAIAGAAGLALPLGSPAAASRGALAATALKASRPEDPGLLDNATRAAGTACAEESAATVCHDQGRGGG